MITTIEPGRYFHVTGTTPDELDMNINAAVEIVREYAVRELGHGICVTRHEIDLYTVALNPHVPYGMTVERDWLNSCG
jgi:hypothetical protein